MVIIVTKLKTHSVYIICLNISPIKRKQFFCSSLARIWICATEIWSHQIALHYARCARPLEKCVKWVICIQGMKHSTFWNKNSKLYSYSIEIVYKAVTVGCLSLYNISDYNFCFRWDKKWIVYPSIVLLCKIIHECVQMSIDTKVNLSWKTYLNEKHWNKKSELKLLAHELTMCTVAYTGSINIDRNRYWSLYSDEYKTTCSLI